MLNRFLQRSEPISFIILLILMSFFIFFHQGFYDQSGFSWLVTLKTIGTWFFYVILMFFLDINIYKFNLTPNNHFAHFIFIVLIGLFPSIMIVNKYTVSFFLILILMYSVYSLRFKKEKKLKLFNVGFVLGVAYLVYPITIIYIFVVYIAYFIYLKIIDKRLLIPIIAFFTPIFLTFVYLYLTDGMFQFKNIIELNFHINMQLKNDQSFFIPFILLGIIIIAITLKTLTIGTFSQLETERNYKIIVAFLLLTFLFLFLDSQNLKHGVIYLFYPSSILMGNALLKIKKEWVLEMALYLLLIAPFIILFL